MLSVDTAARRICEKGDWKISNLALQKILYLSHMYYMGMTDGQRLINGRFEAWDYGPVQPDLYRKVSIFGSKPIQDIFLRRPINEEGLEIATIDDVTDTLKNKPAGELVSITHWEDGAWAKNYRATVRGIVIPDEDILDEYRRRAA